MSRAFNVCALCPLKKAISVAIFFVMSINDDSTGGGSEARYLNTFPTSYVTVYFGNEGLSLKTPLINLFTKG